ncbi:hypothetical protein M9H77_15754 [Catharanthus roseus]|uniref:Uncharacterized protein n=1 Tax=Catharanthus roseus TaxID=4058 RepID=A0ACC0AZ63_CATRO|nr:hypothetical protein M9H77_15754 [Catharanthus roseus]
MEAIQHVRVMLFWDSEIARDAYGPYFTRVVRKSWMLPTTRMISHNELDINTTNMTEHITAVTQIVSDELSMLYTTINDDDDEVDQSDGDDVVSHQSESDDDNNPKEGELQTLVNSVNPVTR